MSSFLQFFPNGGGSSSGGGGGIPATSTVAEVLVVAGGSSGSSGSQSVSGGTCVDNQANYTPNSGGNGGGVLVSSEWLFEQGCSYTVTVGAGGAAQTCCGQVGGENSSIIGYGAPPCALVGYASKRIQQVNTLMTNSFGCNFQWTDKHCSPYHSINPCTCHYGTSVGESAFIKAPTNSTLCSGAAGGAGTPGCPVCLQTTAALGPTGSMCQYITGSRTRYGSDGVESSISGSPEFYGPGGGGVPSLSGGPTQAITNNLWGEGGAGIIQMGDYMPCGGSPSECCKELNRPAVAKSGYVCYAPSINQCCMISACANYGAGGASRLCFMACPEMNGGSGVVFIRYPTDYSAASSVSGNTPTPAQPGYHVYRFNGDGSITF